MPKDEGLLRRWFTRSRDALTSDEVADRLKKIERAVELQYLAKPQAEVTHATATAAAQLIAALDKTPRAALQLGSLLIVKLTDSNGESSIFVRTLGLKELAAIDANPSLLARPDDILSLIGETPPLRRLTSSAEDAE